MCLYGLRKGAIQKNISLSLLSLIVVLSLLYFIGERGCISHWGFEENIISNSCNVGRECFLYLGLYVSVLLKIL